MILRDSKDTPPADLSAETDLQGVELLPLLTQKEGTPRFSMRLFRLAPGGFTPFHAHAWEHEVFVVQGEGEVIGETESHALRAGMAVYVPVGEKHRFQAGKAGMQFICCVPHLPKT